MIFIEVELILFDDRKAAIQKYNENGREKTKPW